MQSYSTRPSTYQRILTTSQSYLHNTSLTNSETGQRRLAIEYTVGIERNLHLLVHRRSKSEAGVSLTLCSPG